MHPAGGCSRCGEACALPWCRTWNTRLAHLCSRRKSDASFPANPCTKDGKACAIELRPLVFCREFSMIGNLFNTDILAHLHGLPLGWQATCLQQHVPPDVSYFWPTVAGRRLTRKGDQGA